MNKISVYILLGILVVFCLGAAVVVHFDIQPAHGWIDNVLIEYQSE
jgi:hypothetical protein